MRRLVLAFGLMSVLVGSTLSARAGSVTVAFSYQFANGEVLSGLVQGDALVGDQFYVNRIVGVEYSGLPGVQFTHQFNYSPGVISMSGNGWFNLYGFDTDPNTTDLTPNPGFMLTNGDVTNAVSVGTFRTSSSVTYNPIDPPSLLVAERFSIASWQTAVVPEPSGIVLVSLAVPLMAVGARLRRSAA